MIFSLFTARFGLRRLIPWLLLCFLLGAGALYLYQSPQMVGLRAVREELPEVFTVLGFYGEGNPVLFTHSMLYGFLLPLLVSMAAVSFAAIQVAVPLQDGRMALLLGGGYRRANILHTLFAIVQTQGALLVLAAFLGQLASALLFVPQTDLWALARLSAGFLMVSTVALAFAFFMACASPQERTASRRTTLVLILMLLCSMLARLPGITQWLRFLSLWTLFDGLKLIMAQSAFTLPLIAVGTSALLFVGSLWSFSTQKL